MNNPKVSIIIATYNSGATLRAALDSVLNQKYQEWECVVVDGASKDNTIAIVQEYEAKDSRFRHISEKDNGIYDAFNKGWKIAKGEWVHYLGSDDKMTPTGLYGLITNDDDENVAVISGNCIVIKSDGTERLNVSKGWAGCHQGKIMRRVFFEKYNGFNEHFKIMADIDLLYRLEYAGESIINRNVVVAYFDMGGISQTFKNTLTRAKERHEIFKQFPRQIPHPLYLAYKRGFTQALGIIYWNIKKIIKK